MLSVCIDFLFPKEVRQGVPSGYAKDEKVSAQDDRDDSGARPVSVNGKKDRQPINQKRHPFRDHHWSHDIAIDCTTKSPNREYHFHNLDGDHRQRRQQERGRG